MPHQSLQYLPLPVAESVRVEVTKLCSGEFKGNPRAFYQTILTLLPVEKMNRTTLVHRVEGLMYVTDLVWDELIKTRQLDRNEVLQQANLKPLSYYHHILGSREPGDAVATRKDFLTDPPTALRKLEDDVVSLAAIVIEENRKKAVS